MAPAVAAQASVGLRRWLRRRFFRVRLPVAIAEKRGVKPGQLALAWVFAKGNYAPIPGTKRRKYLEENAAAANIHLSPDEVAELEAAVPQDEIAGDRYAPQNLKAIDR